MHFVPIISTLRRHKTAATLIVLEIALTCAIVCNAVFLIRERLASIDRPSGVVEDELVVVKLTGIGTKVDSKSLTEQDLRALRAIPGVKQASSANEVPFDNSSWNNTISTIPDDVNGLNATMYVGTPALVQTLGVQIVAGRDFQPTEFVDFKDAMQDPKKVSSILITRHLAERLFPGKNAVGQTVYAMGKDSQRVVGVIDQLVRPTDFGKPEMAYDSMIFPVYMPYTTGGHYILRVEPSRRAEVIAAIDSTLNGVDPARIILDRKTLPEIRKKYFQKDRAMAFLLVGVSIALLIITALGIVGLASFWVQQRTRQIGIRRALGATRGHIVRYFLMENFILATAGIVLGMALAYGINLWLMSKYEVPRLPAEFLPIGALLLWLLGQGAVLAPAMRASMIPPAIATRSV